MTSSPHEPADCELAVCDRCDSYGDGYAAGKDAAYFAISTWELGSSRLRLRLQAMPGDPAGGE